MESFYHHNPSCLLKLLNMHIVNSEKIKRDHVSVSKAAAYVNYRNHADVKLSANQTSSANAAYSFGFDLSRKSFSTNRNCV